MRLIYMRSTRFREYAISWNARKFIEIVEGAERKDVRWGWRTSGFLAGFPPRRRSYRGTAVHYFLMSNKAISMCPDQGPQVLTRVISPRSPACATSSSERRTLLSSPFSATFCPVTPYAGRWRDHVTTLHPRRQGMLRKSEITDRREEDGRSV